MRLYTRHNPQTRCNTTGLYRNRRAYARLQWTEDPTQCTIHIHDVRAMPKGKGHGTELMTRLLRQWHRTGKANHRVVTTAEFAHHIAWYERVFGFRVAPEAQRALLDELATFYLPGEPKGLVARRKLWTRWVLQGPGATRRARMGHCPGTRMSTTVSEALVL